MCGTLRTFRDFESICAVSFGTPTNCYHVFLQQLAHATAATPPIPEEVPYEVYVSGR